MVNKILFRSAHRNPSCGVLDIASGIPTGLSVFNFVCILGDVLGKGPSRGSYIMS